MKRGIPMELRPTQRFPEFIGQKLHDVRLGEVTEESTARNGSRLPPASVMGVRKEDGIVQMEGRLVAADISRYKLVGSNWFAYNPMRLNIGSIARWQGDSVVLVSPDYVVFRCLEQSTPAALHPEYLDHFRRSSQWDAFVNEAGDGGVRVRIYYRDISQLRLIVPDVVEQQKIADCLGSLADLIAAEGRKLEALRRHKQGLMQQLFPQPGETVPRLRFPEFRDAPEWEEKELGDVSEVLMCKRIFARQTNPNGGVPFYKIGTLGGEPDAFISKDLFEEYRSKYNFPRPGEIVITCSGTVGKCLAYDGSEAYFQDSNIVWIDNPTLEVSNEFLLSILSNVNWSTLNSTTIARIYGPDLRGLAIKFPQNEQEQKRIADCLSVLDDQIGVQARKRETLTRHKQGLLHQLFPSLEAESR